MPFKVFCFSSRTADSLIEQKMRQLNIEYLDITRIIFIRKAKQVDIPGGETILSSGTYLTVLGTESALKDFRYKLSRQEKI